MASPKSQSKTKYLAQKSLMNWSKLFLYSRVRSEIYSQVSRSRKITDWLMASSKSQSKTKYLATKSSIGAANSLREENKHSCCQQDLNSGEGSYNQWPCQLGISRPTSQSNPTEGASAWALRKKSWEAATEITKGNVRALRFGRGHVYFIRDWLQIGEFAAALQPNFFPGRSVLLIHKCWLLLLHEKNRLLAA
jgi:hypothetical protein